MRLFGCRSMFYSFYWTRPGLYLLIGWLIASLVSCRTAAPVPIPLTAPAAPAKLTLEQVKAQLAQSPVFAQNFTGFALFDLAENKMVIEQNADKYFTPASNTKIFTFYAGLKILPDSLPALKYTVQHDSLLFWGTGDPTFLHPDLKSSRIWQFLKGRREKLFFSAANFSDEALGPGWFWDDYNYHFSAERSPFPVYGNVVRFSGVTSGKKVQAQPSYFRLQVKTGVNANPAGEAIIRDLEQNQFTFYPARVKKNFTTDIPFKQSPALLVKLLSDTLHRPVKQLDRRLPKTARTLYSLPADSLYKRMMQDSDNTFAEHLLLLCSATVFDSLNTELIIKHVTDTYLRDLPDRPVWVDGSGLSRYNLFTPRTLVALWHKIYQEVPRGRLFALLAAGGKSGTLKKSYASVTPFVFGKTGAMSNNFNQSGFIVTESGKTYIFAFLNNNFARPTADIRQEMERIITQIHLTF